MTRRQRARLLNVRGNIALSMAAAVGLFLAAAVIAPGGWAPLHTLLACLVGLFGFAAVVCYIRKPEGDSPEVTHPPAVPPLTLVEVRK